MGLFQYDFQSFFSAGFSVEVYGGCGVFITAEKIYRKCTPCNRKQIDIQFDLRENPIPCAEKSGGNLDKVQRWSMDSISKCVQVDIRRLCQTSCVTARSIHMHAAVRRYVLLVPRWFGWLIFHRGRTHCTNSCIYQRFDLNISYLME